MPISAYYKGHGDEVLSAMSKEYGPDKGKRVFYATANRRGMNRPGKRSAKSTAKKSNK